MSLYGPRSVQEALALRFCWVTQCGRATWVLGPCDDSLQVLSLLGSAVCSYTPQCTPPYLLDLVCQPAPDGFAPLKKQRGSPSLLWEKRGGRKEAEVDESYTALHMFCMVPFN